MNDEELTKLWKLFCKYSSLYGRRKTGNLLYLELFDDGSGSLHGSSVMKTTKFYSWNCAAAGIATLEHMLREAK